MPLIKNFATQPIFALLVAGCLLSYAPVLLTTYATADDYAVLASSLHGKIAGELTLRVAGGRPIDAMLVGLSFSALPGLGSLRLLRLISVLGIALLAWSLARTLNQQGWSPAVAGCLSFIVCTAPPFQQHAAWTVSAFYPFAAIAAGGAWCMADSAYEQRCWGERWRLAFGAVALELVALSMYQPTAMFFWVFATLVLFSPDARLSSVLHRFGWYSTIMGTALLLGFAVYKLGVLMYGNALPPTRLGVVQDIGEKAVWFFRQPLYNGLNLGHFSPTRHYAVGIAVFLLCGLAVYFQGTLKTRLGKVGIALLVLPLSYMPNLIAAENWAAYRTTAALSGVILVYLFFAVWGVVRALHRPGAVAAMSVTLYAAALGSGLLAAYRVQTYFAAPLSQELMLLREQLTRQAVEYARQLYIIGAGKKESLAPLVRYDEFGCLFSNSLWGSRGAVSVLLHELYPEQADLPITAVSASDPIQLPADALVIDMAVLLARHRAREKACSS